MDERATGLILRTRPLTESSLIVHWLTPDFGRLATVAKGARRPKSPFRGKLDVFYFAQFSFQRSKRSDLHLLREVLLSDTHPRLREDLHRLNQAAYCTALIEQTTESETPLPSLFETLREFLGQLSLNQPAPQPIFAFEMKLLHELGLNPLSSKPSLTGGSARILLGLLEKDWPAIGRFRLTEAQTTEIRQFLHGFIIYHLGRIPSGRDNALEAS